MTTWRLASKFCLRNADRLERAARRLADIDPALAVSIACIRLEEIAKAAELMDAMENPPDNWDSFLRQLRQHHLKWARFKFDTITWSEAGLTPKEARTQFSSSRSEASFKNLGLYVDYDLETGRWLKPWERGVDQLDHVLTLGHQHLAFVEANRPG